MMKNTISQYVRTMFDESRDGWLTIGIDQNRFDYEVDWDENQAEDLAYSCQRLVDLLTMLAPMQDSLLQSTRRLTEEQWDAWNAYLRPFPEHVMDNALCLGKGSHRLDAEAGGTEVVPAV